MLPKLLPWRWLSWLPTKLITIHRSGNFLLTHPRGGGTLGISGWGCAAGTLEALTYTRASSAEFCYPMLDPPYPRVAVFQKLLRSLAQSSQNKTHFIAKHYLLLTYPLLFRPWSHQEDLFVEFHASGAQNVCLTISEKLNKIVHIMCKLTTGIGYVHSIPGSFSWQHLSKMWLPALEIGAAQFCSITEIVPS